MYRLCTGVLPFTSTDASKLVYAHIAKTPENPANINPQVGLFLLEVMLGYQKELNSKKSSSQRYYQKLSLNYYQRMRTTVINLFLVSRQIWRDLSTTSQMVIQKNSL